MKAPRMVNTAGMLSVMITLGSSPALAAPRGIDVQRTMPADTVDKQEQEDQQTTEADEPILLTPKRKLIFEPSLSYVNSSSTAVAIEGFTVVPAIVIGLINVSQVQRDTLTAAVSLRYGITNDLELGIKVPYVYREENVRQRDAFKGTPVDTIDDSNGKGLGDIEGSINYQIRASDHGFDYWVANLQIKSRTGTDIFEIQRNNDNAMSGTSTGTGTGNSGTGPGSNDEQEDPTRLVLTEQPTGSGFWSLQPGLTYIHQSDPAVIYGSISYLWNEKRAIGDEFGGTIDPGDALGFGFGMGLSLNDSASFTLGYSHSIVKRTRIENSSSSLEPSFSRIQVGTLKLGFAQRLSKTLSARFSLGVGVTDAAPDLQLTIGFPRAFH